MSPAEVRVSRNGTAWLLRAVSGPRAAPAGLYLLAGAALVGGLALNAAVAAGLGRRRPLLTQLCLAAAADCLLNLPLGAALRAAPRLQDSHLCPLSAAAALAPPLLQALLVAAAAVAARRRAARSCRAAPQPAKQQTPPPEGRQGGRRGLVLACCGWLYAVAMATPAALDGPRFFLDRLSCGPWRPAGAYSVLLVVLGDALPWLVMLGAAADVGRRAAAEGRRRRRLRQAAALHRGAADSWLADQAAADASSCGCGGLLALVALYLLLGAPAALSAHLAPLTLQVPETSDTGASLALRTGSYDGVLVGSRYLLALILPLLVLATEAEARDGCRQLFCGSWAPLPAGGAGGTVATLPAVTAASSLLHRVGFRRRKAAQRAHRVASYRTPVLFVTSDGLHVRLAEAPTSSSGDPTFRVAFCDLAIVTPGAPQQRPAGRHPPPAFFFSQPEAERDLHVSDQSQTQPEERRQPRAGNGKAVRFRQQVEEIPLAESGVWSDLEPEAHPHPYPS